MATPKATVALISTSADPSLTTADTCRSSDRRAKLRLGSAEGNVSRPSQPATSPARPSRLRLLQRPWAIPLTLILLALALYATNPTPTNPIHGFLFLSYKLDSHPDQYGKGPRDLAFVCGCTVLLTFAREFAVHELLRPLARACGVRARRKQARFAEQTYAACYMAAVAGPLGLYTMRRTPGLWCFSTRGMYAGYPHTTHGAVFKGYYLVQAAFWVQQVVVMACGLERRRSDFRELVVHHGLTVTLIFLSYRFHFTHIGLAVFVTHDISDLFLAISKSLNYLSHPLQTPSFALCLVAWIYLRHYQNLRILRSVATEYAATPPFGLDRAAEQYKCRVGQVGTLVLLAALQALNLFWLRCLVRCAWRMLRGGVARDERSEDEGEDGEVVRKEP